MPHVPHWRTCEGDCMCPVAGHASNKRTHGMHVHGHLALMAKSCHVHVLQSVCVVSHITLHAYCCQCV